jgi:hypothetical protein
VSKFALVLIVVPLLLMGCGEADTNSVSSSEQAALKRQALRHQAAVRRAESRQRARAAARRHHRQLVARRHRTQVRAEEADRRAAQAAEAEARAAEEAEAEEALAEEEASECDPNYSGACLDPAAYDYDCEGGSGDGPDYTGYVEVVGDDPYRLDRDGDGIACE